MILDQFGNPAKASARYEAVYRSGARSNISSPAKTATRDMRKFTRRRLLELSRYFYQNSPTYVGIIERLVAYVVGSGHKVRAKSSDADFNSQADEFFADWCRNVCYGGEIDFLTFQNVVARSMFVDGDVGSVLCVYGGRPYVQQVESHLITDKNNAEWDKPDGVKLTAGGRVGGYNLAVNDDETEFTAVSASRFVLHYFPLRPNQYRGVPVASAALLTIHDLDDILALEKQAVKTASSQTMVITREGDAEDEPFKNEWTGNKITDPAEYEKHVSQKVECAHLTLLNPGDKMESMFCDRPGPAWQGFVEFLCNSIAFSTALPVSLVYGNKVGGADTRRELATAERAIAPWQNRLCEQLQRIYEYAVSYACDCGLIRASKPADWNKTLWLHPPRATVDLGRDFSIDMSLVKAGLMSVEEFEAKNGKNWREVVEQIAVEKAYMQAVAEEYGITPELIFESFKGGADTPKKAAASMASARCKPNQCSHDWAKHGGGSKRGGKKQPNDRGGKKKSKKGDNLKLPDGFKSVAVKDVYSRIGGTNRETITASDGKSTHFSQIGINHFKMKGYEKTKRLQSLDVAQDTVKTGEHFDSYIPNTNIPQTEFIKDYGNKFYYTARRKDTGEVYSWHELENWQFKKKEKMLNEYKRTGEVQKYER